MRKYFGTDGIRGEANRELTVDIARFCGSISRPRLVKISY